MSEELETRKVVFIGDGAVGKTVLIDVFEKGEFVEPPYGANIYNTEKRIKHPTLEGVEVKLRL